MLVHGLDGNHVDFTPLADSLRKAIPSSSVVISSSKFNRQTHHSHTTFPSAALVIHSYLQQIASQLSLFAFCSPILPPFSKNFFQVNTPDTKVGLHVGGRRLFNEILGHITGDTTLVIVAHSLGGLLSRYAIGLMYQSLHHTDEQGGGDEIDSDIKEAKHNVYTALRSKKAGRQYPKRYVEIRGSFSCTDTPRRSEDWSRSLTAK